MTTSQYPRSLKEEVNGLCFLGRLIDKVKMRNAGKIQDYNYLTVGFDKYLLDKLEIQAEDFEKHVLEGGSEEDVSTWVKANGKALTEEEKYEWNNMVLTFGPKAPMAQQAFDRNKAALAEKRGVSVEDLSHITTWFGFIEHDEDRM